MWYCASLSVQIHAPEFIFSGLWVKTWKEKKCVGIIKEDLRETGWVGVFSCSPHFALFSSYAVAFTPDSYCVLSRAENLLKADGSNLSSKKRPGQLTIENLNRTPQNLQTCVFAEWHRVLTVDIWDLLWLLLSRWGKPKLFILLCQVFKLRTKLSKRSYFLPY